MKAYPYPADGKVAHFDFAAKPKRPTFLMGLAKRIISFPDLRRRHAVIRKHGMEDVEGKPYLLLVTHSSMVDFNIMLRATHPQPVNNVMTLEGFDTYSLPLMKRLGVLAKRKFIHDINLIRNIKYCIDKLGTVFVLFPEARYSLDGCTSYLPDSLGSLARMLKVPVVTLAIHGNFITCPQWNKINKGSYVEADMTCIVTADEVKTLSRDEINRRIRESFRYDDFRWQRERGIVIDHPERARGLHSLLYKCARCGAEGRMESGGTELWCPDCGARWEMKTDGSLEAADGGETVFSHIPDWSAWERECVRREIRDGSYRFEDTVRIETLPGWKKFYSQGEGRLIQTPEGTVIEVPNYYGKGPLTVEKKPRDLDSMHIEYDYLGRGDCVDISTQDDSFWCYLSKRDAITKLSFATEEIYALSQEKLAAAKAAD